jgi:hypothetical protein
LIGPLISEGSPAMLRARRLTDAAGAAVWRVLAADKMFALLGEVLMWLMLSAV